MQKNNDLPQEGAALSDNDIRLESARATKLYAEAEKIKAEQEAAKSERKHEAKKSLFASIGKLSKRTKIALSAIMAFVVLGIVAFSYWGVIAPIFNSQTETEYFAVSDLKKAVDVDELSTVEYTYHGIAEKHDKKLWIDTISYRVKYEAHVSASYKMTDIEFGKDDGSKTIIVYLPEPTIEEPVLADDFGYLPDNASADIQEVRNLCREDATADVNKSAITKQAKGNIKKIIKALIKPLIQNDGWHVTFKSITEFNKDGASDEAK